MKKVLAILAVLGLLLAACSAYEPIVDEPEATTITTQSTTEPAFELEPFTPISGEENNITWRTINLSESPELRQWLIRESDSEYRWAQWERQHQGERALGYGLYLRGEFWMSELFRRDNAGRETVLIPAGCPDNTYDARCFDCQVLDSRAYALNERYVLVRFSAERHGRVSVFCVQTLREYPLANEDISAFAWRGDRLFGICNGWYYFGSGRLFEADLATLPNLRFRDALAGMAHEPEGSAFLSPSLCPNGRYYINLSYQNLTIFDLRRQSSLQIPRPTNPSYESFWFSAIALYDNHTLIWFSRSWDEFIETGYVIEITLP